MHDITAIAPAKPGATRSRNFVKNQRWYPTIYDLRRGAKRRLPHFAYEYGDGGAGDDTGIRHNGAAIDAIEMIPRYGVMPELPPVNVELFGRKYAAPLGVAPMGSPIVVWPGADKLLAKAAQRAKVPYTLGVAGGATIEEIAQLAPDVMWLQILIDLPSTPLTRVTVKEASPCREGLGWTPQERYITSLSAG